MELDKNEIHKRIINRNYVIDKDTLIQRVKILFY